MSDFYRIKRLPPYVFEQVNRIKAAARANGADIIDLGMGNPDLSAPQHVTAERAQLKRSLDELGYPYWNESDNPAYRSFLSSDGIGHSSPLAGPL